MTVLLALPLRAREEDSVTKFKRVFEQAMDLAAKPLSELNSRYIEELGKLRAAAQKKGDLDITLLIQDEVENYEKEKERDFGRSPELLRLREIYEESSAPLKNSIKRRQTDIMRRALGKLEEMKRSLTKAGDLDAALRAEELRRKIAEQMEESIRSGIEPKEFKVTVLATQNNIDPLQTKVTLKEGDRYRVVPNETDEWSGGGSKRNVFCDFRGYPDRRVGWMRMFSFVGNEPPVEVEPAQVRTAESEGILHLFAEDGSPQDNQGKIRVTVILNPKSTDR
ncbi:MAG: hypothetical protein WD342_01745 [Verrucomicrobiales bacterium]